MQQSLTWPTDRAAHRRVERSPATRSPRPESRPADKVGRAGSGEENGEAAKAVPTEAGSSQSGSGWSDCSGIPPSTCDAANAALQATPQETRFRQLPGSDLLRGLFRYLPQEERACRDDDVQMPGCSTQAPRQARGWRTSISYSWVLQGFGIGRRQCERLKHASYAACFRKLAGLAVLRLRAGNPGSG